MEVNDLDMESWPDQLSPVEALWRLLKALPLHCEFVTDLTAIVLVADGSDPREVQRLLLVLPVWRLLLGPLLWERLAVVFTHCPDSSLLSTPDVALLHHSVGALFFLDLSDDHPVDTNAQPDRHPELQRVMDFFLQSEALSLSKRSLSILSELSCLFHTSHAASVRCQHIAGHMQQLLAEAVRSGEGQVNKTVRDTCLIQDSREEGDASIASRVQELWQQLESHQFVLRDSIHNLHRLGLEQAKEVEESLVQPLRSPKAQRCCASRSAPGSSRSVTRKEPCQPRRRRGALTPSFRRLS